MATSLIPAAPPFDHLTDEGIKARLIDLRQRVAPILANNFLLHFTDHSVAHSDSLATYVNDLIRPLQATDQKLSQDELFILYGACYLHDIGMHYEKAYETKVITALNLKTAWADLELEERQLIVRHHHAAISAEMVRDSVHAEKPLVGLQLTGDYLPNYIAAISEGHTLDIDSPRYKALTKDGPNLRIEFLSGLLRIADILDLSRRRANRAKALTLDLNLESQTHWWRHHYTEDIVIVQHKKLIEVWFDFPITHAAEYRKVIPQIQMPWIEAEFQRQTPVFHRYGLGWSIGSVISDRPDSGAEPMPDSVLAEMLKQLYRQLRKDEETHRQMVTKLFEEAQPHIDRRLTELNARKPHMSPGDYLREVSRLAADLSEIGGKRSARQLLDTAYVEGEKELEPGERLVIAVQRAELMSENNDTRQASETLRSLVALADSLPDTDPKKLMFWKSWAKSLVEAFAYDLAITALNRAIELSQTKKDKEALSVQLAEIQFLSGKLEAAIDTASATKSS